MSEPGCADEIRFVIDGKVVVEQGISPTTTLLQYLRDHAGRSGTKEGCAEGDCGACTVMLGELRGEDIGWRAINSCIRFLPTVDGCEVVTVESLQAEDGSLHPVQKAMVDGHASQCGFCTPGFVMSLAALYLNDAQPDRAQVVDALSGNLCRCTGYRPIIDAGCTMNRYPAPERFSREDANSPARRALLKSITRTRPLTIDTAPGYRAPLTLDDLASDFESRPDALLLAGGTDIGLWVTKLLQDLPPLIYLGRVAGLDTIRVVDAALSIGAATRLNEAAAAIVEHYPMLAELFERFGSVPIRNSGTLCGNIANGSPIGDSMPVLIALGDPVLLRKGMGSRTLPLEDLYLGYRKSALAKGEFVAEVHVPLPRPDRLVASYKVAKRHDQDISAVCSGYALDLREGVVVTARIAHGGMAATPKRAAMTEAALVGRPWSLASIEAALPLLAHDYQPIGDMRASAAYRSQVAGNLLRRLYLEHSGGGIACRVEDLPSELSR